MDIFFVFFFLPAAIIIGLLVWLIKKVIGHDSTSSHYTSTSLSDDDTRYARTGSYMDFDPGRDSNKIGDPDYPTAGFDAAMKHEFLNNIYEQSHKQN